MKHTTYFCLSLFGYMVLMSANPGIQPVQAVTYDLEAGSYDQTMPDMVTVEMWGFAIPGNPYTSPGPLLTIPPGDSTLTINLTNNLNVPISLVIPGLPAPLHPVYHPPGDTYEGRVRSLTTETASGMTHSYTWTGVRPGTFLYHSGTQMQIQIQMGLYGAVTKNFSPNQAYNHPDTAFQNEIVLLFSEVDPVIHNAVRDGEYGPGGAISSAVDYWPVYFLINGEPFEIGLAPISGSIVGQKTLVRFLNAGLKTHIPLFHNYYANVIADDGNLLPWIRQQYELSLVAGKTLDVILTPTSTDDITIYDRALNLTTGAMIDGGMMVKLSIDPSKSPIGLNQHSFSVRPEQAGRMSRKGN